MDLRPLGRTGLSVSPIGLGTVKLGRNRGVKYPGGEFAPLPSDADVLTLLRTAADLGVNLIDTAPAYGLSEERLGTLLSTNAWLGGRDRWVLSTKVGETFDNAAAASNFDFSPAAIRASIDRSRARLRTDTLDVVLLHSSGADEPALVTGPAIDTLRELKARGVIRAIGASIKTLDGGHAAIDPARGHCDLVMVTYNPREPDMRPVIDAAAALNVGVLIKKALDSGHAAAHPTGVRDALRFALTPRGVSSLIVGTRSPHHLEMSVSEAVRNV